MVSLRGLTLTAARPRIIVPLFARDPAALCPLAKAAGADPAAELVELRLDPLPADEFLNALALVGGRRTLLRRHRDGLRFGLHPSTRCRRR